MLLWLVLLTLIAGGGVVIVLFYGLGALLSALPILLAGAGLILVPWAVLTAIGNWRARVLAEERQALDDTSEEPHV